VTAASPGSAPRDVARPRDLRSGHVDPPQHLQPVRVACRRTERRRVRELPGAQRLTGVLARRGRAVDEWGAHVDHAQARGSRRGSPADGWGRRRRHGRRLLLRDRPHEQQRLLASARVAGDVQEPRPQMEPHRIAGQFNLFSANTRARGGCFLGDYVGLARRPRGLVTAFTVGTPIAKAAVDVRFQPHNDLEVRLAPRERSDAHRRRWIPVDTGLIMVGAGPVGLMTALELRRRGVDVRVIGPRRLPAAVRVGADPWRAPRVVRPGGRARQRADRPPGAPRARRRALRTHRRAARRGQARASGAHAAGHRRDRADGPGRRALQPPRG
jgi:hypothetical protein